MNSTQFPWRGSLLPLDCAAVAKPENAVYLKKHRGLLRRPAGASSLATGGCVEPNIQPNTTTVGAGLLAKAAGQLASILNVPPLREQARTHWAAVNTASATARSPCGSELARDKNDTVSEQNTPPDSLKNLSPTAPTYTPPSSYASLRLYLQLRQNPPACALCSWVLLSFLPLPISGRV